MSTIASVFSRRYIRLGILVGAVALAFIFIYSYSTVSINPHVEQRAMDRLTEIQMQSPLTPFTTDGCSGGLSTYWPAVVERLSQTSESFATNYTQAMVPFEDACIAHDTAYHQGVGGYAARLEADNQLRLAIIEYGIDNASDIQTRLNLESPVAAMFLYEAIAEAVYASVRLGGAPCTGQPYQWGYGYTTDQC